MTSGNVCSRKCTTFYQMQETIITRKYFATPHGTPVPSTICPPSAQHVPLQRFSSPLPRLGTSMSGSVEGSIRTVADCSRAVEKGKLVWIASTGLRRRTCGTAVVVQARSANGNLHVWEIELQCPRPSSARWPPGNREILGLSAAVCQHVVKHSPRRRHVFGDVHRERDE